MSFSKKKWIGILCTVATVGMLLTGCGGEDKPVQKSESNANIRVGMLANLNASEKQYNAIIREAEKRAGQVSKPTDVIYFDDFITMTMGLDSKRIDEMSVYSSTSDYILAKNPKLELAKDFKMELNDSFCCALREEDKELKDAMDKGLQSMKDDGTLDKLIEKYIKNAGGNDNPPAVAIEKQSGADTIKIAVTGDLPPIDLTLSDCSPAGFNTAVLAELSKRIGKNMELIQISSAARAAALESKQVDVVFWAIVPADGNNLRPSDIDKPKGIEFTIPYYKDRVTHVKMK